ncbi:hypothetical protein LCGC14_2955490 [marine sediment metagenome]|uniref:Uncharacterized protein n=1 Tax=marine sediment metagenome TaxID=412755 RepID=A0A0F8XEK9_9ZZZZ
MLTDLAHATSILIVGNLPDAGPDPEKPAWAVTQKRAEEIIQRALDTAVEAETAELRAENNKYDDALPVPDYTLCESRECADCYVGDTSCDEFVAFSAAQTKKLDAICLKADVPDYSQLQAKVAELRAIVDKLVESVAVLDRVPIGVEHFDRRLRATSIVIEAARAAASAAQAEQCDKKTTK